MTDTATPVAEPISTAAEAVPVVETPSAPAPEAANDAVYDAEVATLLSDGTADAAEDAAVDTTPAEPVKAPEGQPAAVAANPITESEEAVLKRAGYDADEYAAWDRAKIESKVGKLRTGQSEQDRIGSELARMKQGAEPKVEAPKTEPAKTPFRDAVATARAKAIADYDEGIAPIFDLVTQLADQNEQYAQQAAVVPMVTNMMGELVLDMAMDSMKAKYPSLDKPEARKQVTDRFWTEWNTGAYSKPGTSLRTQMVSALENAAKVTFVNLTENTAAASLVQANRNRLAGQPKAPQKPRPTVRTVDDVYDEAFNEHLAPKAG